MKEKDSHIAFRIRSGIKQIDPKAKVIYLVPEQEETQRKNLTGMS